MTDNHHNINTTGNGEISSDCCSNCTIELNSIDGNTNNKSNKFKWFDRKKCDEKDVGIMEAAVVVFEGLLHMNGKQISPTESLSMCLTCIDNISEMYSNYREFMERSVTGSYFRELFPLCMLWPSTTTRMEKSISSLNHKSKEPESRLYSVDSSEKTEDELHYVPVKDEIPWDGKIENDENYCDMGLSSDNEHYFETEPFIITTKRKRNKNKKYISEEVKREEHPQFLNDKWILPKLVKVVLKKYVPGDPNTLDIGKSRNKLIGKTIRVDQDSDLTVKKTCSICNKVFTNMKIYFEHRRMHKEKKERLLKEYPCNYCGKILKGKYKLFAHETAVHTTERPFECQTCGKTFPLKERLSLHVKHFHENTIEFRREMQKRKNENRKAKGLPPCSRNRNKYVRWESSHPNEMDKVFCDLCQKTYSSPQAKDVHHRTVHLNEKPFICKFCGHGFSVESSLRRHEQAHLGLRKQNFNCTQCGKQYGASRGLKEHMASVHAVVNPCVCEECGKTYATPIRLQQHKKWVHSKQDTRHKCEQCGKILKNRQVYLCHLKLHTDERPFLCTVCGARFKTRKPLLKHTVTQHGQNAAATCQQCERGFMTIGDYEEHMAKGYHIKPKWLRPKPTRKRNYNAPSYLKARIERKLERQLKRLEKDPNASIEIQSALKKEAEEKLKLLQVKKRQKNSDQKAEGNYAEEPITNINDNNEYESDEYEEEDQTHQWVDDPLLELQVLKNCAMSEDRVRSIVRDELNKNLTLQNQPDKNTGSKADTYSKIVEFDQEQQIQEIITETDFPVADSNHGCINPEAGVTENNHGLLEDHIIEPTAESMSSIPLTSDSSLAMEDNCLDMGDDTNADLVSTVGFASASQVSLTDVTSQGESSDPENQKNAEIEAKMLQIHHILYGKPMGPMYTAYRSDIKLFANPIEAESSKSNDSANVADPPLTMVADPPPPKNDSQPTDFRRQAVKLLESNSETIETKGPPKKITKERRSQKNALKFGCFKCGKLFGSFAMANNHMCSTC